MVGLQIFVEFTDAEGKTHESDATDPVGVFTFEIEDAKASKVNEITVTFANPVEAKNVTFAVTKGTESVPIEKVEATDWSLDEKEVTLKTSANMTKGTYKVTATDSVTKDTAYANFEVTKQAVEGIVILNTTALTNRNKNEAYAYYDVVDQYGTSIRSSASIQWSGSCKIKADKATGKLTLKKNDGRDWVYNEQIYITGVYTKTGVAKSETLTVGSEQALDHIEMVGFLKKGTSDIIQDLPADFKSKEYYLLFHALDQNDCPLEAEDITRDDVTFVSNDILVVKELVFDNTTERKAFTVKGTEYNGIFVTPGIKVADGGEVTVTAIANKTGTKTELNFIVGEDPVVDSFNILPYDGVIADGDSVEIQFEAKTPDEKVITNFRALAKQEIFNTLSFNTSEGELKLAETDSGAAKLTWTDDDKYTGYQFVDGAWVSPWSYSVTTDDIDRPISLTSVVVGGEPDNEMIYVSDKRRPNSIADVNLNDVYVEGANLPISLDTFKYYDQYGKQIGTDWGADNGFFAAAKAGVLNGTDFADYDFGVRIEYAGTGKIERDPDTTTTVIVDEKKAVITSGDVAWYETKTDIQSAATGEGFKFDIAKFKEADGLHKNDPADWESVSPTKFKGITVVDITQVKNFKVGDLKMFYTGALKHGGADVTGDGIIASGSLNNLKATGSVAIDTATNMPTSHKQTIKVTGTYNGKSVDIPGEYFVVSTTKGTMEDTNNDDALDKTVVGKIYLSDLYDKTSANGTAKPGEDEVVATISKIYDSYGYWTWSAEKGIHTDANTNATEANIALEAGRKEEMAKAANKVMPEGGPTLDKTTVDGFMAANVYATRQAELTAAQNNYDAAVAAVPTAASAFALTGFTDEEWAEYNVHAANVTKDTTPAQIDAFVFTVLTGDKKTAAITALKAYQVALAAKAAVPTMTGDELTDYNKLIAAVVAGTEDGDNPDYANTYKNITGDHQAAVTAYTTALKAELAAYDAIDGLSEDEQEVLDNLEKGLTKDTTNDNITAYAYTGFNADEEAAAITYLKAVRDVLDTADKLETANDKMDLAKATKAASDKSAEIDGYKTANANGTLAHGEVYDTAKAAIKYSDQAPYAADITGLLDSYTFNPVNTWIVANDGDFYDKTQKKGINNLGIVDQYGVAFGGKLEFTISNAVENKDGYAENNFKVSDNGTATVSITGAELGDTFDLVVSVQGSTLKKTTKVTVGADYMASIINGVNNYKDRLKKTLEAQRLAGLQ